MKEYRILETLPVIDETRPQRKTLIEDIRGVFADVTRYPLEIVEPTADLETDLGIDSVKLGEIFAVLRDRFNLPSQEVLRTLPPEKFRTIAGIADAIMELGSVGPLNDARLERERAPQSASQEQPAAQEKPAAAQPAQLSVPADDSVLLTEVTRVFADTTRYPLEILEADADFENDLGLDSVKLDEIFAVLRKRYDLPPPDALRETWEAEASRTIRGIVRGIVSLRTAEAKKPAAFAIVGADSSTKPAAMGRKFEGKIALVTGSGRGLGRELALHLGNLGATVIVNSFHSRENGEATTEEIRRAGGTAHHIWASVANTAQLDAMFDTIGERFGGLDFLISNASNGILAPMDKILPEHWEKALRTNVIGLHQSALRAAPLMKARGGGRIVTMSSVAAHRHTDYFGCMGPIKAAVESLTKYLAVELQPHNILVNCISASAIYGGLVDKWPDSERLVPLWEAQSGGRLCKNEDVASLLEYLLGDGASMMNGSIVIMDGGCAAR
jgi:enoyl-[acyl-carrier protein] reductase III